MLDAIIRSLGKCDKLFMRLSVMPSDYSISIRINNGVLGIVFYEFISE